jgi:protein-S-isoprenylcysteine O-methyltransferase Ste14
MSLIPAFELGLWNAWIVTVYLILTAMAPQFLVSKERKNKMGWPPFNKTEKILALITHAVIMPVAAIYSVFLPLKLGTAWVYVGLPVCFLGGVMAFTAIINIANTPLGEPFTKGVYRVSRHPLYFGGFLVYLGVGIACASWLYLLFAFAWIILWHIVLPTEERDLVDKYGDAYREYLKRTPKWIGIPK